MSSRDLEFGVGDYEYEVEEGLLSEEPEEIDEFDELDDAYWKNMPIADLVNINEIYKRDIKRIPLMEKTEQAKYSIEIYQDKFLINVINSIVNEAPESNPFISTESSITNHLKRLKEKSTILQEALGIESINELTFEKIYSVLFNNNIVAPDEPEYILRKQYLDLLSINYSIGELESLTTSDELANLKRNISGTILSHTDILTRSNVRLTWSAARKYHMQQDTILSFLDLVQEGSIGLITGIERYDILRGGALSTYVTWWIKQAISREIYNQSTSVRIPIHLWDAVRGYYKLANTPELKFGLATMNAYAIGEIARLKAEEDNKPESKSKYAEQITKNLKLYQTRNAIRPDAVEEDDDDGNDQYLWDMLANTGDMQDEIDSKRIIATTTIKTIRQAIRTLPQRQQMILNLRYGFNGIKPLSLEDVADRVLNATGDKNVTRERVRQLEAQATYDLAVKLVGLGYATTEDIKVSDPRAMDRLYQRENYERRKKNQEG